MDWLGGLSNIKGQLSNITKDLLAEGTAELTDPESELRAARDRVNELQATIEAQKLEVQSLKTKNEELELRLETTQLRLDHSREQFESQLQEKEQIIQKLRADTAAKRGEPEGQSSTSRARNESVTLHPVSESLVDDLVSEEYGDKTKLDEASSAASIALRNEVTELRASVAKWRKLANKFKAKVNQPDNVAELEQEIEDLRQKLSEAEDVRQSEVIHLRQSHEERVTRLHNQLRDYETQLTTLRSELDRLNAQVPESPSTGGRLTESKPANDERRVDKPGVKKKQSRGKKKKTSLPTVDPPQECENIIEQKLVSVDSSVQTDSAVPSLDQIVQTEARDFTEDRPEDTDPKLESIEQTSVGTQIELTPDDVGSVQSMDRASVAVQAPGDQTSPVCSGTESDPSIVLLGSDDHHSQRSDTSEASSCAQRLDELIFQLSEEVGSYEHVVDQFLYTLTGSQENDSLRQTEATDADPLSALSKKLGLFHTTLQSRRQRLASLRANNHRKRRTQRYLTGSPEPVGITPSAQAQVLETPVGVNQWREDLVEVDFQHPDSSIPSSTRQFSGCEEKETQTESTTESSETPVMNLQQVVRDLEARLEAESIKHESRLAEASAISDAYTRLQCLLEKASKDLLERLPPSVASHMGADSDMLHPTSPEGQLTFLIKAHQLAEDELQARIKSAAGDSPQMPITMVEATQSQTNPPKADADTMADYALAHQLCMILDPEYTEASWDPDQWDAILFDLLKVTVNAKSTEPHSPQPRFSDSALDDDQETQEETIIRLTAEVTALRDILTQHTAYRSQVDAELQELLSTVSTQQGQINALEQENIRLQALPTTERAPTVLSSDDHSDEVQSHYAHLNRLVREHCISTGVIDGDFPSFSELDEERLSALFDKLTTSWSESNARMAQMQSMYDSVVSALQQKHSESHTYHSELQRVYAELVASEQKKETLKADVARLEQTLTDLKSATSEPRKPDVTLKSQTESDPTETEKNADELPSREVLCAEVARLRSHLIEMEETYTTEALNAEAREVDLRNQLNTAQSRLEQLEELDSTFEQRLSNAQRERDDALVAAADSKKELVALQTSMANLQSVLNSFQQSQQAAIDTETEHMRLEMRKMKDRESAAIADLEKMKALVKDQSRLEQRTYELEEILKRSETQMVKMQSHLEQRDAQIDSLRTRLAQMAVDTDSKIDKVLMKNLLLSFLQLPNSQKANGLHVIGNLLHFTEEEYNKINYASGNLPRLVGWLRNAASVLPPGPPKDVTLSSAYPDRSFTDLLLSFLEQESHPSSPLRLPTEYYTPDVVRSSTSQQRRHIPFDAPLEETRASASPSNPPSTSSAQKSVFESASVVARNPLFEL